MSDMDYAAIVDDDAVPLLPAIIGFLLAYRGETERTFTLKELRGLLQDQCVSIEMHEDVVALKRGPLRDDAISEAEQDPENVVHDVHDKASEFRLGFRDAKVGRQEQKG